MTPNLLFWIADLLPERAWLALSIACGVVSVVTFVRALRVPRN